MTLLTGFGNEEVFIDERLAGYEGRLTDVRQFELTQKAFADRPQDRLDLRGILV